MPLVVTVSVAMLSVVMVSLATKFAVWDWFEVPLSSEGREAAAAVVVVVRLCASLVNAAVALLVSVLAVLLSAEIWSVRWLSEFNAWLTAERWLVAWTSVKKVLLLLFVWLCGAVDKEESVVFSVPGGGFAVHKSWSNSGSWWTNMGIGETRFEPMGSLPIRLLVDGWWTALLIADCQLLEQRTVGMLQGETKS